MIPKEYHALRFMVVMPSFSSQSQSAVNKKYFGMQSAGAYTRARNDLFACISEQPKDENTKSGSRNEQSIQLLRKQF
jgi:hypothetical protein